MGRRDGGRSGSSTVGSSADRAKMYAIAVAVGVFCGIILVYSNHHGIFLGAFLNGCTSEVDLLALQSDLDSLRQENTLLKSELTRARNEDQTQLNSHNFLVGVGPFGSVKSERTNPTVQPDESINPDLSRLLAKIAISRELIVGIANNNVREMVRVWFSNINRAGITNYLLVALDDNIADFCKRNEVPFYRRDATISASQQRTGENHAVSALKFHILREFLVMGYSVLLSDVDILFFQNPFLHLYRDCDVEAMSDGHTNQTAYGFDDVYDDPKMGWSRYAHTMRIWVFNSGFFFIRPTIPSLELLDRVTRRLSKEVAWDQAVFNEELFFPSHPGYEGLHASRRVMDYFLFMNSKVMFTHVRKDAEFAKFVPVALHVNYHPDKYNRMLALVDYFVHGKKDALNKFPDGSEW